MTNSNPELSGSASCLLAESKSRPVESITISEMSTRPAQKSDDFPCPIYSFQAQLNQQSSSIESLTKATEKLTNSQLTQQASIEHIHYGQSTERSLVDLHLQLVLPLNDLCRKQIGLVANVCVVMWKISHHTL